MNISILKRIELLENLVVLKDIPSLIYIAFDKKAKNFMVREEYYSGRGTKNSPHITKNVVYRYDTLEKYVFRREFDCPVLMDLMDLKSVENILSFKVDEIRRENIGKFDFSIGKISSKRNLDVNLEIIICERKKENE